MRPEPIGSARERDHRVEVLVHESAIDHQRRAEERARVVDADLERYRHEEGRLLLLPARTITLRASDRTPRMPFILL